MTKPTIVKAHIALLTVTLLYGGNFIIAQDVMRGDFIPPLALVFFRVFGAGIIFWLVHSIFIKEKIARSDIPYLLLCSFIGIVLAQNTFLLGLEKTPTINAALLISTTPIMVAIFSLFILKEKITFNKAIGILLAVIGTTILLSQNAQFSFKSEYFTGNVLIILNAMTYGLYLVILKPMLNKYNALTVVKWVFTFAMPLILIISWKQLVSIEWQSFTTYAWTGLIYVVVGATFLTYALNAYAIKLLTPVIAALYLYAQPFITTLLSVAFGKDVLTMNKFFAGLLILTGLYFAAIRQNTRRFRENNN